MASPTSESLCPGGRSARAGARGLRWKRSFAVLQSPAADGLLQRQSLGVSRLCASSRRSRPLLSSWLLPGMSLTWRHTSKRLKASQSPSFRDCYEPWRPRRWEPGRIRTLTVRPRPPAELRHPPEASALCRARAQAARASPARYE